jgi:hypothetical protein
MNFNRSEVFYGLNYYLKLKKKLWFKVHPTGSLYFKTTLPSSSCRSISSTSFDTSPSQTLQFPFLSL